MKTTMRTKKRRKKAYLQLGIGSRIFGVDASLVQEIALGDSVDWQTLSGDQSFDVVLLHGLPLRVVDLAGIFGLPARDPADRESEAIVVLRLGNGHGNERIGLIVDSVDGVTADDSEQPPDSRMKIVDLHGLASPLLATA